jgi:hypothetical protein
MNDPRGIQTHDHSFEDDGRIPNNPTLPLFVYPQALSEAEREASRCRALLAENGWGGAWVDGVFPYHHYHSVSHEVPVRGGRRGSRNLRRARRRNARGLGGRRGGHPHGSWALQRGLGRRVLGGRSLPARAGKLRPAHRRTRRTTRGAGELPQRPGAGVGSPPRRRRTATPALDTVAL